jgi:hypothetical protein
LEKKIPSAAIIMIGIDFMQTFLWYDFLLNPKNIQNLSSNGLKGWISTLGLGLKALSAW